MEIPTEETRTSITSLNLLNYTMLQQQNAVLDQMAMTQSGN